MAWGNKTYTVFFALKKGCGVYCKVADDYYACLYTPYNSYRHKTL